jgi:hypothetical protein
MDSENEAMLVRAVDDIANAITPSMAAGKDAAGGTIASLTEAVMGITAGLVRIADAIQEMAEAIREASSAPTEASYFSGVSHDAATQSGRTQDRVVRSEPVGQVHTG